MSRFMAFVDRYLVPMRPGDGWQVVFLVAVVVLVVPGYRDGILLHKGIRSRPFTRSHLHSFGYADGNHHKLCCQS